jgi:hypothetical protein
MADVNHGFVEQQFLRWSVAEFNCHVSLNNLTLTLLAKHPYLYVSVDSLLPFPSNRLDPV